MNSNRLTYVVALVVFCLSIVACQGATISGETIQDMSNNFDLIYAVTGGRPVISSRLHVTPDGEADLYMGSTFSLPEGTDTVGYFANSAETDQWQSLNQLIADADLSVPENTAPPPPQQPGTLRSLMLTKADDVNVIALNALGENSDAQAIEQELIALLGSVAASPLAAVQVSLEPARSGEIMQPVLKLTHRGSEPLSLLFVDPDSPAMTMRVEIIFESLLALPSGGDMATPLAVQSLNKEDVAAWVDSGQLVTGVTELSGGGEIALPLGDVAIPAGTNRSINVAVTFWSPAEDGSTQMLQVQTQRIKLDE